MVDDTNTKMSPKKIVEKICQREQKKFIVPVYFIGRKRIRESLVFRLFKVKKAHYFQIIIHNHFYQILLFS